MELEVRHLVECSLAFVALERLLPRMYHDVISQVPFLVKSFATDITNKGLCFTMCSYMSLKRGRSIEALTAHITLMWLLLSVDDFMSTQSTRKTKTFPTDVADEGSTFRVVGHLKMNRKGVLGFEDLSALITTMDSLISPLFISGVITLVLTFV